MESNRNNGRGILGIVLILIGIVFIGRTLGFFPHRVLHYIFTWQIILIVLGIIFISTRENKSTGWILLIIGLVFLAPDVIFIPYPVRRLFWPSILIIIGLLIIFRSTGINKRDSEGINSADYIDDIAILGGGEKIINSNNFKGGRITALFGGSKIDLTDSNLAPGQNIIDVFCMFGGATLKVPKNWNVKVEVVAIFGGFSDKRYVSDTTKDIGKELIIRGFVMFGGGEIKN